MTRAAAADVAGPAVTRELRPGVPRLLIVLVQRDQLVDGLGRGLAAVFDFEVADQPLLLQAGGDEQSFAVAGLRE